MRAGRVAADAHRHARALRRSAHGGREFRRYGHAMSVRQCTPQVPGPMIVKSPAFVPLMLSLSDSENPERSVTVTFSVFVGYFAVSVRTQSVIGVTVAGIVAPVLIETCKESAGQDCRRPSPSQIPIQAHPARRSR